MSNLGGIVSFDKINPEYIIGLPPFLTNTGTNIDAFDQAFCVNSMPVLEIQPALPSFGQEKPSGDGASEQGLQLYHLVTGDSSESGGRSPNGVFKEIFDKTVGDDVKPLGGDELPLYVSYLNDVSISESFNVDYGESSFESFANIGSTKIAEIRAITGSKTASGGLGDMAKSFWEEGGAGGVIGAFLATTAQGGVKAGEELVRMIAGNSASYLVQGSKIDFPSIWKGSSYSPAYAVTVRLYNPNPHDWNSFCNTIIRPLSKLLALVVPIGDRNSNTYNFPLLCKINCPGIFDIGAGYIQSIDVIKGGEVNDIGHIQRLNMIDLRLSFGQIYNSLIHYDNDSAEDPNRERPTLRKYVDNIKRRVNVKDPRSGSSGASQPSNVVPYTSPQQTPLISPNYVDGTSRISPTKQFMNDALKMNDPNNIVNSTDETFRFVDPEPAPNTEFRFVDPVVQSPEVRKNTLETASIFNLVESKPKIDSNSIIPNTIQSQDWKIKVRTATKSLIESDNEQTPENAFIYLIRYGIEITEEDLINAGVTDVSLETLKQKAAELRP